MPLKFPALRRVAARRIKELQAAPARRSLAGLRSQLFMVLSPAGVDVAGLIAHLRSHPDVLCHGDLQGPLSPQGYAYVDEGALTAARKSKELVSFRNTFPAAFLYKYVLDSRGRTAVGFAVDHDILLSPVNAPVRDVLQQDLDVKILLYAPKNILQAYASGLYRQRTLAGSAPAAVMIEPQRFLAHARQSDRMSHYVERMFPRHAKLNVESENLQTPKLGATLHGIAAFLGVERFPDPVPSDRDSCPELGAMISNLAAVVAALRDTPYAWMSGS